MNYGYVYRRAGGPLLTWKNGPPNPSRGGETVAMGSLADPTIEMPLPRPGAPEPLGCSGAPDCADCAGCKGAMGGFAVSGAAKVAALGLGALLAYRLLVKKRR